MSMVTCSRSKISLKCSSPRLAKKDTIVVDVVLLVVKEEPASGAALSEQPSPTWAPLEAGEVRVVPLEVAVVKPPGESSNKRGRGASPGPGEGQGTVITAGLPEGRTNVSVMGAVAELLILVEATAGEDSTSRHARKLKFGTGTH